MRTGEDVQFSGHGLASARGFRLAGARKFGLARACRGLDFVVGAVLWASYGKFFVGLAGACDTAHVPQKGKAREPRTRM